MTGRRTVWFAALALGAVLVLFGLQLHDTQKTMRRDIEARFRDRAEGDVGPHRRRLLRDRLAGVGSTLHHCCGQ
jgi:hypothetical protein